MEYSHLNLVRKDASKFSDAGDEFLKYLETNWMPEEMWSGWSMFGRLKAAVRLQRHVSGILPTTNHLESFNGVLKNKYLPQWQYSGHRLRFDILIFHLVVSIFPRVFAQLRMQQNLVAWKEQRFRQATGGRSCSRGFLLTASHDTEPKQKPYPSAWLAIDGPRDLLAAEIYKQGHVTPIHSGRPYELWATCTKSLEIKEDGNHARYWLTVHITGAATCTCADWLQ